MKIENRVKFYADKGETINKLFVWKVRSMNGALKCLERFIRKGYEIRAAWYQDKNGSQRIEEIKIEVKVKKPSQ